MNKPKPFPRARTPQILQMETAECGAACLGMVLAFHGGPVPLAELRTACGISREGSNASHLLRAARGFGLIAQGWRVQLSGVEKLTLPAIVYWNQNHFVVLEGVDRSARGFWINDPAEGHRRVSAEEFSAGFSGVALTFSPGPEFQTRLAPEGLFRWMLRKFSAEPSAAAFASLAAALLVVPALAVPILMRILVDDYYIGGELPWLHPLLACLALAALVQIALTGSLHRVLLRWEQREAALGTRRTLERLLAIPTAEREARGAAELAGRLALPAENARRLFRQTAGWALQFPVVLASVVWMALCGWPLALLVAALIAGNATLLWALHRSQTERRRALLGTMAQFENVAITGLATESSGPVGWWPRLAQLGKRVRAGEQELRVSQLSAGVLSQMLAGFAFAGILVVGAIEIAAGELTIGSLVAFLVLWLPLRSWLREAFGVPAHLSQISANLARLRDLPIEPVIAKSNDSAPFHSLELRHVSFSYVPSQPLLNQINLTLKPGQRIALIGPSGSGKTTLIRLLTGCLAPTAGQAILNGRPAALDRLAPNIAWAGEEPIPFSGTMGDYLRLGGEALTDAEIQASLRAAGLASTRTEPERPVTELSDGERQQLEMARLFARQPGLVILDEATSGLDPAITERIQNEWHRRGCAQLWVTHDPQIARRADEIWVLTRGGQIERGTWEELAKTSPSLRECLGL